MPTTHLCSLLEHKTAHKGKSRTLYLTTEAVAVLVQQRKRCPTGALLRNCWGVRWTKDAIGLALSGFRKKTGITHATAYCYRHTFATDALANGVPDAQVAELLGHSGTKMLHAHYAHLGSRSKVLKSALANIR